MATCSDNKNCAKYEELIQRRLDGDLSPHENAVLNEHLADCENCREELVSYAKVQSLLKESVENPVEVPEGFFESLADELEERESVRGFARFFNLPAFTNYRNYSLVVASLVLIGILGAGVIQGHINSARRASIQPGIAASNGLIQTNRGGTIELPGDEGNQDRYAAALDDLERAYKESQGDSNDSATHGYIHTSYKGKDVDSPIH